MRLPIIAVCFLATSALPGAEFELSVRPDVDPVGARAELLAALRVSQANGEPDRIVLPKGAVYLFSGAAPILPDFGATHLPPIIEPFETVIVGQGSWARAEAGAIGRFLAVDAAGRLTVQGLTFRGGSAPMAEGESEDLGRGGAISNRGRLDVQECAFFGNQAGSHGGAIANRARTGVLHVEDSHFEANQAFIAGGALDTYEGGLFVTRSAFLANSATEGGAVATTGGARFSDSTFSGNSASLYGGAIRNLSVLSITDCQLTGNRSGAQGGGVANRFQAAQLSISGSEFSGNQSGRNGGGLDNLYGSASVVNTRFLNNSTATSGGGIGSWGALSVKDCTVAGNLALANGGGIFNGRAMMLEDTGLTDNRANANGGGLWHQGEHGPETMVSVVVGCGFSGNVSDADEVDGGDGGGVFMSGGNALVLSDTIMFANADRGGEAPEVGGMATSAGNSVVAETSGSAGLLYDITGEEAAAIVRQAE